MNENDKNSCKVCKNLLENKRKGSLYCCVACKAKANKNLKSIKSYFNSVHGKTNALYNNAKTRAKELNLEFSLSKEWIAEKLSNGFCEKTGLSFVYNYGSGKQPWGPSLDRIDPNKGYTEENTQVVVWIYNSAKNVFSDEDVLNFAKALVKTYENTIQNNNTVSNYKQSECSLLL